MRIGMTNGRGFGGTVRYDLDVDGRNDKETEILHAEGVDVTLGLDGRLHGDPDRIAQSFRIQADMNPRVTSTSGVMCDLPVKGLLPAISRVIS